MPGRHADMCEDLELGDGRCRWKREPRATVVGMCMDICISDTVAGLCAAWGRLGNSKRRAESQPSYRPVCSQ